MKMKVLNRSFKKYNTAKKSMPKHSPPKNTQRLNIESVIKWKNPKGIPYNNSVCVVLVNNERYLFKIPRYSSLKANWEYTASKRINKYLKGMFGFSKVRGCKVLYWDQDKYGLPIPKNKKPVYPVLTSIQNYIQSNITFNGFVGHALTKIDDMLCLLIQTLVSVHMAQKSCQFTHYDLHTSNVMVRDLVEKNVWNLYNITLPDGTKEVILIPSLGFRSIIIDYEFCHTKELFQETHFQKEEEEDLGRIDLIDHGYIPFKYDPICDSVRIFMSAVRHYLDAHKNSKERSKYTALKYFYDSVYQTFQSLHPNRDIDPYGLKFRVPDYIKNNFLDVARKSKKANNPKIFKHWMEFCEQRYSVTIDLLSQTKHYFLQNNVTVPKYEHDRRGRIEKIVDVFELLFDFSKNNWDKSYKILEEKLRTVRDTENDSCFYYIVTASEAIVELYKEFIEREHRVAENYPKYVIDSLGPLPLAQRCYDLLSPDVKKLHPLKKTTILTMTESETNLKYVECTPNLCQQLENTNSLKDRGQQMEIFLNSINQPL